MLHIKNQYNSPLYADYNLIGLTLLNLNLKGALTTYGEQGEAGQVLTAQGGGNAPKWTTISGGGGGSLPTLGTAGQLLKVNAGATALEYFTPNYGNGIYGGSGTVSNSTVTVSNDLKFELNNSPYVYELLFTTTNGNSANGDEIGIGINDTSNSKYSRIQVYQDGDSIARIFSQGTDVFSSITTNTLGNIDLGVADLNTQTVIGLTPANIVFKTGSSSLERMRINSTGQVGIGTTSPSSKLDVTANSLGVTQTNDSGLALVNTTAAAAGAQQMSPGLRWRANGWKTNSTAGSQTVDFVADVLPEQGAASPLGVWNLKSSINGATFINNLSVSTAGDITASSYLPRNSVTLYRAGTNGYFEIQSKIVLRSPNDGVCTILNTSQSDFNRLQFGGTTASFPALGRSTNNITVLNADGTVGAGLGIGTTSPDRLLHAEVSDAVTNAVTYAQRLSHVTSGTATTGFGVGREIELENGSGTNVIAATEEYTWSDATAGSEDTTYNLKLTRAGSLQTAYSLDSAGNMVLSGALTSNSSIIAGAGNSFRWSARSMLYSPADSIITLGNNLANDFNRLQFGGTTSSFPSIKRSGAALVIRLADDSAHANFECAQINTTGSIVANGGSNISWNARTAMASPVNGDLRVSNAAGSDFGLLQFGGGTASFPALKRSGTNLQVRVADDTAFSFIEDLYRRAGAGSPEGVVTAPVGAVYHRTDGGANTSFYVKESGTGNTGWIAK